MEAKTAIQSKHFKMYLIVTGATGFVGQSLRQVLLTHGHQISAVIRNANTTLKGCEIIYKDLNGHTDFADSLNSIEVVIHLAGRAHVLNEQSDGAGEEDGIDDDTETQNTEESIERSRQCQRQTPRA